MLRKKTIHGVCSNTNYVKYKPLRSIIFTYLQISKQGLSGSKISEY